MNFSRRAAHATPFVAKTVENKIFSHVPELKKNLLSVSCLHEKDMEVIFNTGADGIGTIKVVDTPSDCTFMK